MSVYTKQGLWETGWPVAYIIMFFIAMKQNSLKYKIKANYNIKDKTFYKIYFKNESTAIRTAEKVII